MLPMLTNCCVRKRQPYTDTTDPRVRPWVLTTLGRPGEGLCSDLRRLARLRLQRPDASQAVSAASVLQRLLHRWRAELSCAIVMGDTSVYLAAPHSESVGHVFQELGPADLQVYDLQNSFA